MNDSRATTRFEPYIAPTHGTAVGYAGATRAQGIAPLGPIAMHGTPENFGLIQQPRAASFVRPRVDTTALSRTVVSVVRPIWYRISLLGSGAASPPRPTIAPDASAQDWA